MAGNHLESLVAEWYEYRGYFVRRNVRVGKRPQGGYECELDIVAFNPEGRRLVHIEPSMDADSWAERERRYSKKFGAGRQYINGLFPGIDLPGPPEQIALFVYGGSGISKELAGGRVMFVRELLDDIRAELSGTRISQAAVPEEFPLLRTLQFANEFWSPAVSS